MATVTAYYPSDFSFQNAWFLEIPAQSFNSTSATVAFGYHQMNMTGVGIAFPLNALPTGTITGSSIYGLDASGVLALHVVTTGLNYNFTNFVNTLRPAGAAATPDSYLAAMGLMFTAADTFNGSAGNDVIYSFGGNDILRGNAGNDILEGGGRQRYDKWRCGHRYRELFHGNGCSNRQLRSGICSNLGWSRN